MTEPRLRPTWVPPLLFVLVSLLMATAGAHLLETIYYHSFGLNDQLKASGRVSPWVREDASPTLGFIYLSYRYGSAIGFLILGYQCLALREWARRCMVGLLAVDLVAWLARSVVFLLIAEGIHLTREEILLQVAVVAVESALLGLLTLPAATAHFGNAGEGRESSDERATGTQR